MTFSIGFAGADSVPVIMPVMRSAFDPRFGEAWREDQCTGALTMPGTRLAIASSGQKVLGFALWRVVADESELLLIAVQDQGQRTGVGSALLRAAARESKESGAEKLFVEVRVDNSAIQFYHHHGFEQCGLRSNYYKRSDGGPTEAATLVLFL